MTPLRVRHLELRYVARNGLWYLGRKPFTGVALSTDPDGRVIGETEFEGGCEHGRSWQDWQPGVRAEERTFFRGGLHGRAREWHANGRLALEGEYEYSIALWERRWDPDGNLISELLSPSPVLLGILAERRRHFGQGGPAEAPTTADPGGIR